MAEWRRLRTMQRHERARGRQEAVPLAVPEVQQEWLSLQRNHRHDFREHQISARDVVSGRLPDVPVQEGNERATDSPADWQRQLRNRVVYVHAHPRGDEERNV